MPWNEGGEARWSMSSNLVSEGCDHERLEEIVEIPFYKKTRTKLLGLQRSYASLLFICNSFLPN